MGSCLWLPVLSPQRPEGPILLLWGAGGLQEGHWREAPPSPEHSRGSGRWMAAALETKANSSVRSWVGGLGWRGRE